MCVEGYPSTTRTIVRFLRDCYLELFFLLLNLAKVEADFIYLYKKLFDFFKKLWFPAVINPPSSILTYSHHYQNPPPASIYRNADVLGLTDWVLIRLKTMRWTATVRACTQITKLSVKFVLFQVSICTKTQAVTIFSRGWLLPQ